MGESAEIRATVFSSNLNGLVLRWFYEGSLLDPDSNPRYSLSMEGSSLYVLTVASVGADTLGRYQAMITVGGRNKSDTVQLALPGM